MVCSHFWFLPFASIRGALLGGLERMMHQAQSDISNSVDFLFLQSICHGFSNSYGSMQPSMTAKAQYYSSQGNGGLCLFQRQPRIHKRFLISVAAVRIIVILLLAKVVQGKIRIIRGLLDVIVFEERSRYFPRQ